MKCKTCNIPEKYLGWDDNFCTLECKVVWMEKRIKELEDELHYVRQITLAQIITPIYLSMTAMKFKVKQKVFVPHLSIYGYIEAIQFGRYLVTIDSGYTFLFDREQITDAE